jgi:hypothetical protein
MGSRESTRVRLTAALVIVLNAVLNARPIALILHGTPRHGNSQG